MTIHPLLNRPEAYSDETLASWLWRLARQNYADSPAWFLPQLRETWPAATTVGLSAVNGLRNDAALTGIATLTRHSVVDIYQHTLHRFANVLTPPGQSLQEGCSPSGTALTFLPAHPSKDLYSRGFSWCPKCLAEARYVRLHWHLPLVACCELHHCWLLESCPQCHAPVAEIDVIYGRCGKCRFKLQEAVTPAIPETDELLQLQSTVMHWLYGQPEAVLLGLPEVPVNTLIYVLVGLRFAAQRAGNGWAYYRIPPGIPAPDLDIKKHRRLTVFERGCLYATAFRGLRNWPEGLFAYLDAYRQRPGEKAESGLQREFGMLHRSWFGQRWAHPAFGFIQEAFNNYLVARVPAFQVVGTRRAVIYPDLLLRTAYLDIRNSARYVGVCAQVIHRLRRDGHLTAYRFESSAGIWFSRLELDQLRQRWEGHITIPEAARLLGVSIEVTRNLLKERLIRPVPASEGLKLQLAYLSRDSVLALIQKLKAHTTVQANMQRGGVSMAEVCRRNASVGLGFSQLLDRICAGRLPACHPSETLFPLTAMWVPSDVVVNLSRLVKAEREWLDLRDTERCLGIRRKTLYSLIRARLLKPIMAFGQKRFFSQADVLALRDRCTSPQQAAILLDIPVDCLFKLVRHGLLVPLWGSRPMYTVFDRHQLIVWREEHMLYSEIETLTSNPAALMGFLKARQVNPLVTKPAVYRRKEVMAILKSMPVETDQSLMGPIVS